MIITMNPIQTLSDPESRKPETKTLIFNISLEKENKIEDYSFEDVAEQIEDWILNSKNDRFGISYTVEGEMSLGGRPPFPYFYAQMPFSIIERIPKS